MGRLRREFSRRNKWRPQYRLRLEGGRCLTYYEVGQHGEKARRGDLILAIYGSFEHAKKWRDRYNAEWKWLGLQATIWAYKGSKPLFVVDEDGYQIESKGSSDEGADQEGTGQAAGRDREAGGRPEAATASRGTLSGAM